MLLDLRLPKVDGLQVLKQVKENRLLQALPVVILTTSAAERDLAMAYEYHANSYLTKPINFEEFHQMLTTLGCYWLVWNRCPW
jgi:CheY-like chemotaxis protein